MSITLVLLVSALLVIALLVLAGLSGWLLGIRRGRAEAQPAEDLLRPVGESLDRIAQRIDQVERSRAADQAGLSATLSEQLRQVAHTADSVRRETGNLHAALGRSEVRGAWGEASLRRMVEAAGMLERVHFTEQDHQSTEAGVIRPDLIIHLDHNRNLVVDSKVPLNSFLKAQDTDDPLERKALLAAHAKEMSGHIDRLSTKQYWRAYEPSPDFVIAYVPSEALLAAALAEDSGLLDRAFAKQVVLATPTTFWTLLRTVDLMWRQEAVAEHAREIATLGRELHDRLVTLTGHLSKLGKSLDGAVGHYNTYVASMEARVFVTARKMNSLGVGENPWPEVTQIETAARRPTDEQITDGAAVA